MTGQILLYVLFLGLALSADAFAVSITDGLIYRDMNKKRGLFIALVFGAMQAIMPLIGFWLVELIQHIVLLNVSGNQAMQEVTKATTLMSDIVTDVSAALLLFVGIKMLVQAIIEYKKPVEEKKLKLFSKKEVLWFGFITAIDALVAGVSLHATKVDELGNIIYTISNQYTVFLHVGIIFVCTFILSMIGVSFGHVFEKAFKGKYEIANMIGGIILILLALWIYFSYAYNLHLF